MEDKYEEYNVLIARFMGYAPNEDGLWHIYYEGWDDIFESYAMEYHRSWAWLMPVVENIECTTIDNDDNSDNFFNVMIEVFECNINGGEICICESGNTKREATYNAVVEFIKWYNKNQKA